MQSIEKSSHVQKLRDLLERVEKASGADRDIDVAISRHFGTLGHAAGMSDEGLVGPFSSARRYTASLDASIGLVERMLPGWGNTVGRSPDGIAQAAVFDPDRRKPPFSYSQDRADGSRPLALLTAALRALISQAEGEGQKHV